jgi:hypothetical protein
MDPIERALETVMDGPDLTHAMGYHINVRGELVREKRYHVIFHSILNIVYLILWQMNHLINRLRAMESQVDTMDMMVVEEMCRQIDDAEPLSLEDSSVEDSSDSADEDERRMYFLNQTERRIVNRLRRKEALARQAKATCPSECSKLS